MNLLLQNSSSNTSTFPHPLALLTVDYSGEVLSFLLIGVSSAYSSGTVNLIEDANAILLFQIIMLFSWSVFQRGVIPLWPLLNNPFTKIHWNIRLEGEQRTVFQLQTTAQRTTRVWMKEEDRIPKGSQDF